MSSHLYIPSLSSLHGAGSQLLIKEIADCDKKGILCPEAKDIFKAFNINPLSETKIVILGQDPYHTRGKANGLAFGYNQDYKGPLNSSLENIIREVYTDTGQTVDNLSLVPWAKQGVLLINTRLTTEVGKPLAHKGMGWEREIGFFLERLGDSLSPHVYMLWGREAQSYKKFINNGYNLILEASHPCKFSAHISFQGCRHFSKANEFLRKHGKEEIKWGT